MEYLYSDRSDAETHFVKLRTLAARLGHGDDPLYNDTLETFVAMRIAEVLAIDVSNLRQFLDAMIRKGLREGLAKGNQAAFNRYLALADSAYERRYAAPNAKFVLEEARLPPFRELVANSFVGLRGQEGLPLMERARIWAWSPEPLRAALSPQVGDKLRAAATAAGLDVDRAFPGLPAADQGPPGG